MRRLSTIGDLCHRWEVSTSRHAEHDRGGVLGVPDATEAFGTDATLSGVAK